MDSPEVADDRPPLRIALAATFTLEPVQPALDFWARELGYAGELEFAPYNQVLQQLIDPTGVLASPHDVNVIAVRFEDFARFAGAAAPEPAQLMRSAVGELCQALEGYAGRYATPTLVWVGPASDRARAAHGPLLDALEAELQTSCSRFGQLHFLGRDELARYPVELVSDERRDEIGHIPYTPALFTALATTIARRIHAIKTPAIKVIAVDCDNTLWKGVVGEEGPHGISFPAGKLALQHALIRQQTQGVVICLVSKNVDDDVGAVFRERPDMPLRPEHIVAQRVNWLPKSANVAELAAELNVGIDSFLFIDDNPVECAEMKAAHPQITTLLLPEDDAQIAGFIDNIWAFDRLQVTEEDQKRTLMYQQNRARNELEQKTGSIGEFLRTLDLKVSIDVPAADELPRVAQLTQKTNQFNFTTRRRNEGEIAQLSRDGLECLRVHVSDRFGDYGLVGVMIFGADSDALRIDTLLLSCRVLGRGVEHHMLAHLGKLARERGLSSVAAPFVPTKKNQPASNFLESLAADKQPMDDGQLYVLTASVASEAAYRPGDDAKDQLELARTGGNKPKSVAPSAPTSDKSRLMQRLSCTLTSVGAIQDAIAETARVSRPELTVAYVEPRSEVEATLAAIWRQLLNLDRVGVHDDFHALGGTSLLAAELFVEIEDALGVKLPMTTILEASTISLLEQALSAPRAERRSLKKLRDGQPGGPQLFLVHDGDGETLLYVNLARRLPADVTVWGIEPLSGEGTAMLHTEMQQLAAYYLTQIRSVQPEGPYYLGGMCAGGTIAFEVGLQLEEQGDRVALVALIDSADAKATRKIAQVSQDRLQRFLQTVTTGSAPAREEVVEAPSEDASADGLHALPAAEKPSRLQAAVRKISNVVQYETNKLGRGALNELRFRMLKRALSKQQPIPEWTAELTVRDIYERLEREYTPAGQLRGKAVLYRATWNDAPDRPLATVFRDPQLGWPRRMQDGVLDVCDVPGGHSSLLREPQVAEMASDLGQRIAIGAQTADHHPESSPSRAPDRAHAEPPARI